MCKLSLCIILLIFIIAVSNGRRFSLKVFVKCIKTKERFCENKNNSFSFNDGCNICKCNNSETVCPERRCKFSTTVDERRKYCHHIRKKAEKGYQMSVSSSRSVNHLAKNTKSSNFKYKRLKWPKFYGNYWYRKFHRRSLFNNGYYSSQLRSLKRRKRYVKKIIKRLNKKKKQIKKKYKKLKQKYEESKENYNFSLSTRLLKYKMRKQKRLLRVVKKRLKYYYKRLSKTKKDIKKLQKKMGIQRKEKSKLSLVKKYKRKSDLMKRLRELYKKNQERINKLKRKKVKVKHSTKYQRIKNDGKKFKDSKKRLMIQKRLDEIIKRIKENMKRVKKRYLKAEGDKKYLSEKIKLNVKKNEKKRRRKKNMLKIKVKKERKIPFKNIRKEIQKLDKDIKNKIFERTKKEKNAKKKIKRFPQQKDLIRNRNERIVRKEKLKKRTNKPNKYKILIPAKIKDKTKVPYRNIHPKLKYKKNEAARQKAFNEKKHQSRKVINENEKIIKNINAFKTNLKNHLQSLNSRSQKRFREKIKEIFPILKHLDYNSDIPNSKILKRYFRNKKIHLTPKEMLYLRMINNDMYKKYLRLYRLSLLEKRIHHQLSEKEKNFKKLGYVMGKDHKKHKNHGNHKKEKKHKNHKKDKKHKRHTKEKEDEEEERDKREKREKNEEKEMKRKKERRRRKKKYDEDEDDYINGISGVHYSFSMTVFTATFILSFWLW